MDKQLEESLGKYFARWRRILMSSGETRKDLAESSVKQLYMRLKGKEPQSISWCASPYQIAVLPKMVAMVSASKSWARLVENCKSASPGSSSWQKIFDRHWQLVSDETSLSLDRVCFSRRDLHPSEVAAARAKIRLRESMRELLLENVLIKTTREKAPIDYIHSLAADKSFFSHIFRFSSLLEQAAGLKFGSTQESLMEQPEMGAIPLTIARL
ncbi:MAG: hypothetical protein K2X27_19710, partial [Candidatus Obscuribacterales bacterium]|nr:hypothetical protein [Candidatus Obscuribacterales bacterium]